MTVYLGTHGKVELKREFDGTITGTIKPDDVNTMQSDLALTLSTASY